MSYWSLFAGFFRVGLLGFGGGPSYLPLMQAECVNAGWMTDEQFLEGLAITNALPGPITTKMALYVGFHEAGVAGAAAAFVGLLVPSTALMAVLLGVLVRHRDHWIVTAALKALKPAIVGMLAWVAWDLAPGGIKDAPTLAVALGAFAALLFRVHPAVVIVAAVAVGLMFFRG